MDSSSRRPHARGDRHHHGEQENRHSGRRHHHPEQGGGAPGGRGHHPGRGRGPMRLGRGRDRMERGALRPVLLDTLREAPRHGYDIIKAFEERSRGQYAPSPGAVYPTLQYLEDLGLVRSGQEGDRRIYELTEAGQVELDAQAERVEAFWSGFAASAPSEATQHDVAFLKEDVEDLTRTIWRGLRMAIAKGDQGTIRSVRRVVQQCQEEIRSLIAVDTSPDE